MSKPGSKKEQTRKRILEAVHRGFRARGYEGAGVDGLAKEAGVTSGAFYAHLGSKAAAFKEAVAVGMDQFREGIDSYQQDHGEAWLRAFAQFYLGEKRTNDLAESCALQSLTPDVSRADDQVRHSFQDQLKIIADHFGKGLPHQDQARVWQSIAMLVGGVTLARAVKDPDLADEIAAAVVASELFENTASEP